MVVAEGRVLYRDVNHSAPVIAFLDAAALKLGDGTFNSIRAMEVVFAVAGGWLALFVAWRLTNRLDLATVLALLFVMLASRNFLLEEGNVTEEFGMVFALAGVAGVLASRAVVSRRSHTILTFCSGVAFGLAALSKEPFIYSSVAWLGLTVAASRVEGPVWKRVAGGAAWFIGGMAAVFLAFVLYLLVGGAFIAWADSIAIAVHYAGLSRELLPPLQKHFIVVQKFGSVVIVANRAAFVFAMIGVVVGVVSLARPRFAWKLTVVALVAAVGLLFEYYGASTSGRPYGHYFLQTLPSYFVLACCGAALVAQWVEQRTRRPLGVIAVAGLLFLDWPSVRTYRYLLAFPHTRIPIGAVSMYVSIHRWSGDHLWSPSLYNSRFYVETGLTTPVSYSFVDPVLFQDTRFIPRRERLERLAAELRASPPEWMVLREDVIQPLDEGIMSWICANYARLPYADVAHGSIGILYARVDRMEVLHETRVPDSLCGSTVRAPASR